MALTGTELVLVQGEVGTMPAASGFYTTTQNIANLAGGSGALTGHELVPVVGSITGASEATSATTQLVTASAIAALGVTGASTLSGNETVVIFGVNGGLAAVPLVVTTRTIANAPGLVNITGNSNNPGGNGVVVHGWTPNTQLPNWIPAMTAAAFGSPTRPATIVALGDSTVAGAGAPEGQSAFDALTTNLTPNSGILTLQANWPGDEVIFNYITLTGGTTWNSGFYMIGHAVAVTSNNGDSIIVAPTSVAGWPTSNGRFGGTFDTLEVYYYDANSSPMVITITGGPGSPASVNLAAGTGTGNALKQTLSIPSGLYSNATVTFTQNGSSACYIGGCALWNSRKPGLQVFNLGVGGTESSFLTASLSSGANIMTGTQVIQPSLAMIDMGINDYLHGITSLAQTQANLTTAIATLRSINCDPILIVAQPIEPFGGELYTWAQMQAAIISVGMNTNTPVIDLTNTYGGASQADAYWAFFGSGTNGQPHPSALGYGDIGDRYSAFLTNTPQTFPNSIGYPVPPVGPLD